MTRDDLLAALLVERYTNPWWSTSAAQVERERRPEWDDSEITTARRRRELVEAWDERVQEVAS